MFGWLKSKFGPKEPAPPAALSPLEAAKAHWARAGRPADQVSALEEVAACGGAEARAILEGALTNVESVHAQIAAARLLADLGDKAALPVLERVANPAFWKPSEEGRARAGAGFDMGMAAGRAAAQGNEALVRQACENALKRLREP